MTISSVMNTALSGLQAQSKRMDNIASNTANQLTPGYSARETGLSAQIPSGISATTTLSTAPADQTGNNTDPLQDAVGMMDAKNAFHANADAFEAGADMWDVLMSIKRD